MVIGKGFVIKMAEHHGWFRESKKAVISQPLLVLLVLAAMLAVAWFKQPADIAAYYFFRQDVPSLVVMVFAALIAAHLPFGGRWNEAVNPRPLAWLAGACLLLVLTFAGHWLVMLDYDLSRDESMTSFAASQFRLGEIATHVPEPWQAYGQAMQPLFLNGRFSADMIWVAGYLPVNSVLQALAGAIASPALANPLLLIIGLLSLWSIARQLWPDRRDAAVIVVLIGATSSQLIITAMTSYAMTGHFALNTLWLALFLKGGRYRDLGALLVGLFAAGLHQYHFHLMFAAPFLLFLLLGRKWGRAAFFAVGYSFILLFWAKGYPAFLLTQVPAEALSPDSGGSLGILEHVWRKLARLGEYPLAIWGLNLVRFAVWQNILLVPLFASALIAFRDKWREWDTAYLSLVLACLAGLIVMVFQGHGWGYRYLSGLIGCFALLAGYGWLRLVPEAGAGRPWAMLRAGCLLAVVVILPMQMLMARGFVSPFARIYKEAVSASADVVLVDIEGGFYAQDLVQNAPDLSAKVKLMDLSQVPEDALANLCRTQKILRIDQMHYRAVGMPEGRLSQAARREIERRRAKLDQLDCAPRLPLS